MTILGLVVAATVAAIALCIGYVIGHREGYDDGRCDEKMRNEMMNHTFGASRPTGETFDEGTLVKVYDAIYRSNAIRTERQADDIVNALQNAGILFRERES